MDTSPTSAPVYGGGLVEVGIYADIEIPEYSRLFLVFDGSKQRQVTEARLIEGGRRLQAVIPDHEPPEIVALSLIIKLHSGGCRTLAQEPFTYFLDQTCYLARYLADSVHDLEALEDWDYIRGPQFSLANEDFPTLDERLTSAFQHLILPPTWNLLGDPSTVDIPRETLFHFAARLGLSSFVTLLLEKNGAAECLQIRNKHDELAKNIARSKSYDGLADLITDPHAHGVIRWESTHRMTQSTTIKRHSFGTVTTSTEMHNGDFPPIEDEINTIIRDHPPPTPDKPELIKEVKEEYNISTEHTEEQDKDFDIPTGLEITNTTNATWGSEEVSVDFVEVPPPVPPKPKDLYMDYEYDSIENGDHSEYTQNESSSYLSPNSIDYSEGDAVIFQGPNVRPEEGLEDEILEGNLRHLQKISTDIHYIRQKDIARLKQSSPTDAGRLSNSCPNLGQDSSFISNDTDYLESFDSPAAARSRQAISSGIGLQHFDAEFPSPVDMYGSADDLLSKPHNRSPLYIPDPLPPPHLITVDQNHLEVPLEQEQYLEDEDQDEEDEERENRSSSPTKRPHSWNSVEKLNELKPDIKAKEIIHSHKRSQSYQGDEFITKESMTELTPEEKAEQADTITSPSVRRVRRHNNNAFAVVGPDSRDVKSRSVSLSVNNNNNAISEADRRFTISEGVISDPANFETDAETPPPPRKPDITTGYAAKPFVPPRPPDAGTSRNIVSRKLSFLSKMRSSTRTKTAGGKDRTKKVPDMKANSNLKPAVDGDNLIEANNKEVLRDLPWHTVKSKNKKGVNLNAQRPQSMMISKLPATYSSSLTNNGSYVYTDRVHNLPTRNFTRPISTNFESAKSLEPSVIDSKLSRNSYKDDGDSTSLHSGSRTPPHMSQYNNISGSMESLDETDVNLEELNNDPDLILRENEPEAWSVTVEKKMLKKMDKKDIKRQDNIFEFIQKERNFLTTLKIMQKIFANGMSRELQCDQDVIDKMFPQIDEFVEFTSNFVQKLDDRQHKEQVVSRIGDILVNQWKAESGRQMLWLFSEFCSKQKEIVSLYKDMLKNDKKFHDFTGRCHKNPLTRRRDIPGCILLVTQRITKYPVILKTLIDNSKGKDHKLDCVNLNTALELITDIIKKVDKQVLEYEKLQKAKDIYQKMEGKGHAAYKDGRKFTRDDFNHSLENNKLLQVGTLQWKPNTMKRPTDVTVLLFKDSLVFLQENNQRYSFASVGQPAAVPLHKLIVREKAGEDSALFLLSASSNMPEMYELICQSASDSKNWMQWIRAAADECPEEDEGVSDQDIEVQKRLGEKWVRANQLISDLEERDQKVNELLKEKMMKFKLLVEVLEKPELTANMKFGYPNYVLNVNDPKNTKAPEGAPTLHKAIEQVNKLSHAICGPGGLNRNPSSVGEHDSGTYPTPALPKRSETFGGFDNGKEPPSPRSKWSSSLSRMGHKQDSVTSSEDSRRDSGLIKSDMSHAGSEQRLGGYAEGSESSSLATGQGLLLPPTPDQISALAQLTHLLNEYLSVATQQDTQVQKMTVKMMQAQTQSRRRNGNQFQEMEARRNQAKHSELEQDLAKREEQLKNEREQFDKRYRRFQASMDIDMKEFDKNQAKLKRDEIEVQRREDEVRRQKEEYQREMVRLRELQRQAGSRITHSVTYPNSLSNKNNSNNAFEEEDYAEDSSALSKQHKNAPFGQNLASLPSALSKSHSSLEGELSSGDGVLPKESTNSPTYSSAGDYPKTFPGMGKRDQQSNFLPNQHHQPVQPPIPTAGQAGAQKPIHLQYSATNQVMGHVAPPRHSVIPSNLSSSSKAPKHGGGGQQVIPTKLTKLGSLSSNSQSNHQSSSKQTFTDGLKSKLPFSHHKKTPRSTNSSSDLIESKSSRSNTLSVPNNLKHSKSEANMDVASSNNRGRSTSSPSPATSSLNLPDSESGLERSNSASSSSSKEGTEKKKKNKRGSWGSNSEKPNATEIYF